MVAIPQLRHEQASAGEITPIPFAVTTNFAKRLAHAAESMSIADAVYTTLQDSGIEVKIDGDLPPFDGGLVMVGDHTQHIEPLLAQAIAASSGRPESRLIAMPTSLTGRLIQSVDPDLLLPVVPTMFSKDHPPAHDRILHKVRRAYRRHTYPMLNRSIEDLRKINTQSIDRAAEYLEGGEVVTIFPSHDPARNPWRKGIGEIAREMSPEAREKTNLYFFKPQLLSLGQLGIALALREVGLKPEKRVIHIEGRHAGTLAEVTSESIDSPHYSATFAREAQKLYQQHFL